MAHQKDIFVTGGTGKTGARIVARLKAQNLPVRVGSRNGQPPFDWENPATWGPALQDVSAVYIAYQPDLAVPGAVETIRAFTAQAVAANVQRLVLLSGRGEPEAQACEEIVQQAGVEWTVVRASWFSQNFSESFLLEAVLDGTIMLPVGDNILEPFIDVEDIADVAVAALTQDGHNGQLYELTGPRLMTFTQSTAHVAQATGRDIQYVQVTAEQYMEGMKQAGIPEDYIWLINYLFTTVMDGRNAYVMDGVQRALGRAPRDFAEYARETAATGVWNGEYSFTTSAE